MSIDHSHVAFSIVNQMHAMVAYWDTNDRCLFSNVAYQRWFNKTLEEMATISLQDLLGPDLYALNLPYLQGVMRGEKQVFEHTLARASDEPHRYLTTYIPDVEEGVVCGFSVHVTELPVPPKPMEWLPVCSNCKDVQAATGDWYSFEEYFSKLSKVNFTHGLCPKCLPHFFPNTDFEKKAS